MGTVELTWRQKSNRIVIPVRWGHLSLSPLRFHDSVLLGHGQENINNSIYSSQRVENFSLVYIEQVSVIVS